MHISALANACGHVGVRIRLRWRTHAVVFACMYGCVFGGILLPFLSISASFAHAYY